MNEPTPTSLPGVDAPPDPNAPYAVEVNGGYVAILRADGNPTCVSEIDTNSDPAVGVFDTRDADMAFLRRIVYALNACARMPDSTLAIASSGSAPDVREWFDGWGELFRLFGADGDPGYVLNELKRLRHAPPTGYVIEAAEGGRWRTLDTIGMPVWTDKLEDALCVSKREHADAYAADDPEDVRIMPVVGARSPGAEARHCLVPVHPKEGADWDALHHGDLPPWPAEGGYEWKRVVIIDAPGVRASTPESIEAAEAWAGGVRLT